jgi:hypothetical protein
MAGKSKKSSNQSEIGPRHMWVGFGILALIVGGWMVVRWLGWGDGLYEVQGQVLRAGQPITMEGCRITFLDPERGIFAPAVIGADGSYRVYSYKESGLRPGTYSVVVSFPAEYLPPTDPKDPLKPLPPVELEKQLGQYIPKKYRDPKTSGLSLTIVDEDIYDFNVDMVE